MKITDEAVRAAVVAMNTNNLVAYDSLIAQQEANARSILTAALPHLQTGYKVKQLEWSVLGCMHKADLYEIEDMGPNWSKDRYQLWCNREVLQGVFGTLDEAKSAAQEDFEDNVRECIVGGVDVSSVRRQVLEEAATLIDEGFEKQVGKAWRNDGKPSKNDECPHGKFMYEDCEQCASYAIRALSAEPTLKGQQHDK